MANRAMALKMQRATRQRIEAGQAADFQERFAAGSKAEARALAAMAAGHKVTKLPAGTARGLQARGANEGLGRYGWDGKTKPATISTAALRWAAARRG